MRIKLLSAAVLATVLMSNVAEAAGPPQLYRLNETPKAPAKGHLAVEGALEEFAISLDPELVAADPETLLVQLPFGPTVEAHRVRSVTYSPTWKSWSAELRYPGVREAMGYAILVYHGDSVTGILNTDEGRFQIARDSGRQRLVRVKDAGAVICPVTGKTLEVPSRPSRERRTKGKSAPGIEKTTARLDLLAVYPNVVWPNSEYDVQAFIQSSVSIANDIFTNSGVNAYYNLVYQGALLGTQPPNRLDDDIDWMNDQADLAGSELNTLRDAFGADIVALFVPLSWNGYDVCGIANLVTANGGMVGSADPFGDKAFSAQRSNCGLNDYTMAHEIGHNYGMRHDDDSFAVNTYKYSYGRGFLFTVSGLQRSTVMGCTCKNRANCPNITNAVCGRIPYFSDDSLTYGGVTIGDSTHRNAEVASLEVGNYAAFRTQSSNTPPNAYFYCSCTYNGSNPLPYQCTLNASGTTDNASLLTATYRWDFQDGTNSSGKIIQKNYQYPTTYLVRLTVTDSQGQRDTYIGGCHP